MRMTATPDTIFRANEEDPPKNGARLVKSTTAALASSAGKFYSRLWQCQGSVLIFLRSLTEFRHASPPPSKMADPALQIDLRHPARSSGKQIRFPTKLRRSLACRLGILTISTLRPVRALASRPTRKHQPTVPAPVAADGGSVTDRTSAIACKCHGVVRGE